MLPQTQLYFKNTEVAENVKFLAASRTAAIFYKKQIYKRLLGLVS